MIIWQQGRPWMLLELVKKSRYDCKIRIFFVLNALFLPIIKILLILQDAIFRIVASILHLGNVRFAKGEEIDSSVLEDDKSKFHLQTAAELLMYDQGHYTCITLLLISVIISHLNFSINPSFSTLGVILKLWKMHY